MKTSSKTPAFLLAAAFSMTALLAGATPALAQDKNVAAIVNGDKIMRSDVQKVIQSLPQQQGINPDQIYYAVLNEIINEKLIDKAVVAAKIEESKEYKERLEGIKAQLAKQVYLEKRLKDKITDNAVKKEYDEFSKANKGKVEVRARHILVSSEAEALQVIKDLDDGQDFVELAKKRSSGPTAQTGGDVGFFAKEEMIPAFSDAAFKLKPGAYTKTPVKTDFGWHVIKVETRRPRVVPDLSAIEVAIRQKLGQQALQDLVSGLRKSSKIDLFDSAGNPVKKEGDAPKETKK